MEVSTTRRCSSPGHLENWSRDQADRAHGRRTHRFDLRGHYSADARFDLSDPPIESVSERSNGLTFRFTGGARLVVTWPPMGEEDLV